MLLSFLLPLYIYTYQSTFHASFMHYAVDPFIYIYHAYYHVIQYQVTIYHIYSHALALQYNTYSYIHTHILTYIHDTYLCHILIIYTYTYHSYTILCIHSINKFLFILLLSYIYGHLMYILFMYASHTYAFTFMHYMHMLSCY